MNPNPPTRHSILPPSRTSTANSLPPSAQSSLQSRITQKRAELKHLQQLRDLSATLASQMTELESKLSTLRDGAESVALVMRNWEGVLGVIGMAGSAAGEFAKRKAEEGEQGKMNGDVEEEPELPVTLVRIPVETKGEQTQGSAQGRGEG